MTTIVKNFISIFIALIFISCGQTTQSVDEKSSTDSSKHVISIPVTKTEIKPEIHKDSMHEYMAQADLEYFQFEKQLTQLYVLSETNQTQSIYIADSLIKVFKEEYKKTRHSLNQNKIEDLNFFKGEVFYIMGDLKKALSIFINETDDCSKVRQACVYTKMKNHEKAYNSLKQVVPGYYLYDFELAMYYETIGKKDLATKTYNKIKHNDSFKNYVLYDKVLNRLKELEKEKPMFLKELDFPTGRPGIEI